MNQCCAMKMWRPTLVKQIARLTLDTLLHVPGDHQDSIRTYLVKDTAGQVARGLSCLMTENDILASLAIVKACISEKSKAWTQICSLLGQQNHASHLRSPRALRFDIKVEAEKYELFSCYAQNRFEYSTIFPETSNYLPRGKHAREDQKSEETVCFPSKSNYVDLENVIGAPARKFSISGGKPDGGLEKVRPGVVPQTTTGSGNQLFPTVLWQVRQVRPPFTEDNSLHLPFVKGPAILILHSFPGSENRVIEFIRNPLATDTLIGTTCI